MIVKFPPSKFARVVMGSERGWHGESAPTSVASLKGVGVSNPKVARIGSQNLSVVPPAYPQKKIGNSNYS